ncbi:DUF1667 domain-containing protein [Gottschalkiaceae bacterium SANA]|nr:DUF1667 domain-containing protein [Gottschalkiaceae bacterium SANA]
MAKEMTCIVCPIGCQLTLEPEGESFAVFGNKCPRGKKYAIEEMIAPKRVITSTVAVDQGMYPVISVKTQAPVPKELIFDVMQDLSSVLMKAPIQVGDVVIKNVQGTGVDVVATRNA